MKTHKKACNKCEIPLVRGQNWCASSEVRSHYVCKVCEKFRKKGYYKASSDAADYQRGWQRKNPERVLYNTAKHRAKKKGLPFEISLSDVVIPDFCPVLGIKLARCEDMPRGYSASLDRRECEKGYVPGNVAVISYRANTIKSDATVDELKSIVKWMEAGLNR